MSDLAAVTAVEVTVRAACQKGMPVEGLALLREYFEHEVGKGLRVYTPFDVLVAESIEVRDASAEGAGVVSGFDPDWVIAPGATLRDWREENGLGQKAAATTCAMTLEIYQRIEDDRRPISHINACKLQQGTGIPATLWLNLDRIYRAGLAAGKTDTTDS